jgi:hypothetical protein
MSNICEHEFPDIKNDLPVSTYLDLYQFLAMKLSPSIINNCQSTSVYDQLHEFLSKR